MTDFEINPGGRSASTFVGMGLDGVLDLDRRIALLETRVATRVAKAAITAGLTPVGTALRAEINSREDWSRHLKRGMRLLIGKRVKKAKGSIGQAGFLEGKIGFGVGRSKSRKQIERSGKNKSGVGLSGRNAHWHAAGTKLRQTADGKAAGRINYRPMLLLAVRKSADIALGVMRRKSFERLEIEVTKLRKGKHQ